MAGPKSYTPTTANLCSMPVKVGSSFTWQQTITCDSIDPTDYINTTKENTEWSVDGTTWYDTAHAHGLVNGTLSFTLWIKFSPSYVGDTPGTVTIEAI